MKVKCCEFLKFDLDEVLAGGENQFVEFKWSILWSEDLNSKDFYSSKSRDLKKFKNHTSEVVIAREIAGFLNSKGGLLIIGVDENKGCGVKIVGIRDEFSKLKNKDCCRDGYRRMIVDSVLRQYFPVEFVNNLSDYVRISFVEREEKLLCLVEVAPCESPIFLVLNKNEHFFIRIDAEIREINERELALYCLKRFS